MIKRLHLNKNINNMIKITKLCTTLLLCLGSTAGYAQEAATSSGNNVSGSGGSVSYSVGQVAYITNTGKSGSISQGVQQAFKTAIIGVKNAFTISSTISPSVFPNPTADNVTLQIANYQNENLTYQLFDTQGMLLKTDLITGIRTKISTSGLPPATYFLYIVQGKIQIQSFKIIKN
jgi:Secretion system C-terminal sorting domain